MLHKRKNKIEVPNLPSYFRKGLKKKDKYKCALRSALCTFDSKTWSIPLPNSDFLLLSTLHDQLFRQMTNDQ